MSQAHKQQQMRQKNAEEDAKRRALIDKAKEAEKAILVAQWESGMERRDVTAARKREDLCLESEARSSSTLMRSVRMAKLEELYRRDREIYEEQLNKMGLAFSNSDF